MLFMSKHGLIQSLLWQRLLILLIVVTCDEPASSDGVTTILPELLEYQQTLNSSCDYGYEYVNGSYNRTCDADGYLGYWTHGPLFCTRNYVPLQLTITNSGQLKYF